MSEDSKVRYDFGDVLLLSEGVTYAFDFNSEELQRVLAAKGKVYVTGAKDQGEALKVMCGGLFSVKRMTASDVQAESARLYREQAIEKKQREADASDDGSGSEE